MWIVCSIQRHSGCSSLGGSPHAAARLAAAGRTRSGRRAASLLGEAGERLAQAALEQVAGPAPDDAEESFT